MTTLNHRFLLELYKTAATH